MIDALRKRFARDGVLADYKPDLTRDDLVRLSRILVIDDERPDLVDDLAREGYAVDHDAAGDDTAKIEKGIYHLVILDYAGVGKRFGKNQGLDILKRMKEVNPAVYVLAYTSKSLSAEQSDFYRLTDGTLSKDAGVQESLEKVEQSLREALDLERLWRAALVAGRIPEAQKGHLTALLVRSIRKRDPGSILGGMAKVVGCSVRDTLVGKLVELLIRLTVTKFMGP